MSFAPIGATLISKGIDQFTFGVGQEYRRHERHRMRDYQTEDIRTQRAFDLDDQNNKYNREFKQKMAMADQFGIHPLAMMGNSGPGGGGSSIVSSPPTSPPISTPSGPFVGRIQSKDEKRITRANADKAEAEARLVEHQVQQQMGQNSGNMHFGNASLLKGQADGDIFGIGPIGLDRNIDNTQKASVDREGNVYVTPKDNEAFSDEAPIKNRILYNWRDIRYPFKVNDLKNNWTDPKLSEFKYRFLQARPSPRNNNEVVLWSKAGWVAVRKNKSNKHKIFLNGGPTIKAYKFKKKKSRITRDRILKKALTPGGMFRKGSPYS